jgi:hypothetical protein
VPLWHRSGPCAGLLLALAAALLVAVSSVDEPLRDAAEAARIWRSYQSAKRSGAVVQTRLDMVHARLAAATDRGPSAQRMAILLNEEANLERQAVEYAAQREEARAAWKKRTFGLEPEDSTPPAGLFHQLRDTDAYAHAAFKTLMVGGIAGAFLSFAAAGVLLVGKLFTLDLKDAMGVVKDHLPKLTASSSMAFMPILGSLIGVGALSVGAAAAVTSSMTFAETSTATSSAVNAISNHAEANVSLGPVMYGWITQPVIERYREVHTEDRRERWIQPPHDLGGPPARVTGDVIVTNQSEAWQAVTMSQTQLSETINTLNQRAEHLSTTIQSVSERIGQASDELHRGADRLAALQTNTKDTALAATWLLDREHQKSKLGFGGRLKGLFVGVRAEVAPPVTLVGVPGCRDILRCSQATVPCEANPQHPCEQQGQR